MSNSQFQRMSDNQINQLKKLGATRIPKQQPLSTQRYLQRQPLVKEFDEEIKQLKYTLPSFWIFVHSFESKPEKNQPFCEDYQQFRKMYKSDFLRQYFFLNWSIADRKIQEFAEKIDIEINCYITTDLFYQQAPSAKLVKILKHQNIRYVVMRNNPKRQESAQQQKYFCSQFLKQNGLQDKNGGFVYNVNEAIEMQKKIFSFITNTMKPNYFILNSAKNRNRQISNNDSDILINTKAYLKESLDLKQKQLVIEAFNSFKLLIEEQFQYKKKMSKDFSQSKLEKQQQFLENFFQTIEKIMLNNYPFQNQNIKRTFLQLIINSYTEQSSIYRTVNNLCKRITSKQSFMKIAFYCKFLNEGIKYLGMNITNQTIKKYKGTTLYRESIINPVQWDLIKFHFNNQKQSTYLINLAFMSSSFSQQISKKFGTIKRAYDLKQVIKITISPLFWQYYDNQKCKHYLEYFIDMNLHNLSSKTHQEQVLFNCFNVFKVIKCEEQGKRKILNLEAFGHLQILDKKIKNKQMSIQQKQILDIILRVQEEKDYVETLKEQGKTTEIVSYLQKAIDNGIELSVSQSDHYIRVLAQRGQQQSLDKFIGKLQQKAEKTVEQQVKLAIKDSIWQDHIESQYRLLLIESKLNQKKKGNWKDQIQLMRTRLMLAENKQSTGSFDQALDLIKKALQQQLPYIIYLEIAENIQTWLKFLQFIQRHLQRYCQQIKFTILNKENLSKLIKDLQQEITQTKRINQLRQSSRLSLLIKSFDFEELISIFLYSKQKIKQLYEQQNLRIELQNCKKLYYQRIYLKVKFLRLFYTTLIRSEKMEIVKTQKGEKGQNSQQIKDSFTNYFQTYRSFFENIYLTLKLQKSKSVQYQKYLFFVQIFQFMNGLSFFFPNVIGELDKKDIKTTKIINQAGEILMGISMDHYDLTNLKAQQIEVYKQTFFSQKRNKYNLIKSRISVQNHQQQSSEPQITLQQILNKKQKISKLLSQNEESYQKLLLPLAIMKSQTSRLSIIHQASFDPRLSQQGKRQLSQQFSRLSNKIKSTLSNQFLVKHTTNAYHLYLKASFFYYSKQYEEAIFFIQQCEQIYEQKLKNTIQRMESESDQIKKKNLINKINNSRRSNEVLIKIEILRSNICINYKPKLYKKCLNNLSYIYQFIGRLLDKTNSSLPQILYYKIYLQYLNQGSGSQQQIRQALRILLPLSYEIFDKKNNKLKYLKYYTLYYLIAKGDQKKKKIQTQIQLINKSNNKLVNQELDKDCLERLQYYYIYKIQRMGSEIIKQSVISIIQKSFSSEIPNKNIKILYDKFKQLFTLQTQNIWKAITNMIRYQLQRNIGIVNPTLIILAFIYSQYLINSNNNENYQQGLSIINSISWDLKQMLFINRKRIERHINSNCSSCLEQVNQMKRKFVTDKCKKIVLGLYQYRVQIADDKKRKEGNPSKNYYEVSLKDYRIQYLREEC